MATYRLVEEEEWKAAVEAVEALARALKRAGTVIMPDAAETQPVAARTPPLKLSGNARDGVRLAKQIVERVNAGGPKHQPKVFDRVGPKIADFVYLLTDGTFTAPEALDKIKKYVALKEKRKDAGGQVRTAIRADARFELGADGKYIKKNS
jgi:hypothetical protein